MIDTLIPINIIEDAVTLNDEMVQPIDFAEMRSGETYVVVGKSSDNPRLHYQAINRNVEILSLVEGDARRIIWGVRQALSYDVSALLNTKKMRIDHVNHPEMIMDNRTGSIPDYADHFSQFHDRIYKVIPDVFDFESSVIHAYDSPDDIFKKWFKLASEQKLVLSNRGLKIIVNLLQTQVTPFSQIYYEIYEMSYKISGYAVKCHLGSISGRITIAFWEGYEEVVTRAIVAQLAKFNRKATMIDVQIVSFA